VPLDTLQVISETVLQAITCTGTGQQKVTAGCKFDRASNLFSVDLHKVLLDNGVGIILRIKRQKPKT